MLVFGGGGVQLLRQEIYLKILRWIVITPLTEGASASWGNVAESNKAENAATPTVASEFFQAYVHPTGNPKQGTTRIQQEYNGI